MFAIYKRDLFSYFTTPTGYVYVAVFLAVNGAVFSMTTLQKGADSSIQSYFTLVIFALMILVPLLTMKSFSEEKRLKTEQLLMTSPVSLGGMVFGKFLSAYTVFAGSFLIGCINFTTLFKFGPKDYDGVKSIYNGAILLGSVIAVLLIGAAFVAIGIFISSLTENQIVSGIVTIAVMALFLVVGMLNSYIPFAPLREALSWLSIYSRFGNFANGLFDFSALIYYFSISFVFLFLTVRVYEKRRWA